MMRFHFLRLSWLAICIFCLTLRTGAVGSLGGLDSLEKQKTAEQSFPEDAPSPPTVPTEKQVSLAVVEALRILRPLQPKSHHAIREKNNGILGKSLFYAKELFYLLFMNDVPLDPTTPRKLSRPLKQATTLLSAAATLHDPDAIFLLAEMNFHGNYTYPRNYTEAVARYQDLASLNGNATAQHMLGLMYATGYGDVLQRDQAKALLYHTFAAKAGDTRSEMTVAYRYHTGIATPRNCNKAAYYYKKVADKAIAFSRSGPPGGQALLRDSYKIADESGGVYGEGASVSSSGMYAKGGGPNSDANAAFDDVLEYLDLMSRKGDLKATFSLGRLHYEGSRSMKRNLRTARAYFMTVARRYWQKDGSVREEDNNLARTASKAAGYIGRMFLRGEGMEQSYEKALLWFKRGVKNGDALCQYELGVMYLNGLGVRIDPLLAGDYFRASAEQDFASGQVNMGKLLLDQGNVADATHYFDLAARHSHIEALYHLGEIHNNGVGRERSCNMAASYFKMVAEKAETIHSAFDDANNAYDNKDMATALPLYMMAAEQGYESAQANVAFILDEYKSIVSLSSLLPSTRQPTHFIKNGVLALIYWTRSAKQSNIDSMVKMGDYYLYGHGVEPDMEKAASCYQTAAETHQSAQALWNLGWIHENGIGVVQDFHLAKRFYDEALETNKEAYLPVKLALGKLWIRSWWNTVTHGDVRSIKPEPDTKKEQAPQTWSEFFNSFLNDPHPYYHTDDDGNWINDDEYLASTDPGMPGGDDEYYDELDESLMETAIIFGLMGVLAWLIWYRNQRALGHRREMERTGNVGPGQQQVEQPPPQQVENAEQQQQMLRGEAVDGQQQPDMLPADPFWT